MVDSNDRDRVVEARDELHRMLNEVCGVSFIIENSSFVFVEQTTLRKCVDFDVCSMHCICL